MHPRPRRPNAGPGTFASRHGMLLRKATGDHAELVPQTSAPLRTSLSMLDASENDGDDEALSPRVSCAPAPKAKFGT